jgi:hypothetical protein
MMSDAAPRKRPRRDRRRPVLEMSDLPANVVMLRLRIMPRHTALLARWLEAGRRMGLCEAAAFRPARPGIDADGPAQGYVLIWVRENIDPAYMVTPEGARWVVVDSLRHQTLARLPSFAAALHFIRPVLSLDAAA